VVADAYINSRVTAETKALLRRVAARRGITEAVLIRQVLNDVIGAAAVAQLPEPDAAKPRDNRLYVRLAMEDLRLLRERSLARRMTPATYLAVLARAHLRGLTPLPKDELQALKHSVAELGAIGRNLNQLARAAHQGERGSPPGRDEFAAFLKVAEGLRDHIKSLVKANEASWRTRA
jgi:antitoxin component of RelBE/YafQ-DinJ toxin-antitoxin module